MLGEQYFCSGCWMCFFPTEEFVWRLAACESIHVAHLIGCSPCCLAGTSIKESNVKFRFWTLPWLWKHIPEEFKLKHKTCWNVRVLTSLMFIYLGTKNAVPKWVTSMWLLFLFSWSLFLESCFLMKEKINEMTYILK